MRPSAAKLAKSTNSLHQPRSQPRYFGRAVIDRSFPCVYLSYYIFHMLLLISLILLLFCKKTRMNINEIKESQ